MLFIIIAILVFITQSLFSAWWWVAVVAFVAAVLVKARSNIEAILSGFLGVAGVWAIQAFFINQANEGLLAGKIAPIFSLPSGDWLLVITGVIGGLVGAFSAWSGYSLRVILRKK